MVHRVTVAEPGPGPDGQSRNSDIEKFASVVKLARFCSPDGLRRPCPTADLPPGSRVTVGADCAGPAPSPALPGPGPPTLNKWQSIASPRVAAADALAAGAVTRTQLGLPVRRRTTAAVTAKARNQSQMKNDALNSERPHRFGLV